MSGPNVRDLVGDIREAVDRHSKEELVEILTYVFKEYVVEGPAPIAAAPAAPRSDFDGLSFAEVIRELQRRLDLPELALFDVQGDRVTVRVGGRPTPIDAQAARPTPAPVPVASPAPAPVAASPQASFAPPPLAAPRPHIVPSAAPRQPGLGGAPGTSRESLPAPAAPAQNAASAQNAAPAQSGAAKPAETPPAPPAKSGWLEID